MKGFATLANPLESFSQIQTVNFVSENPTALANKETSHLNAV